jgi:Protein of unknown function (DUF1588)/Protein of unknown function (DUF1587)/Protein of unknown function (DUF1585)/Protein of unknown function (DUF1592)/Protein of unknown function (DUF1595)/Planctomycete cytochrome C
MPAIVLSPNSINVVAAARPLCRASIWLAVFCSLIVTGSASNCLAEPKAAASRFRERVQPLLETYCYGCHGNGASEGNRAFDQFESDEALVGKIELWQAVLKNVRAGIMPPAGEERPNEDECRQIFDWIKSDVFNINLAKPDPGRVTIRRLNRVEYRNTIRDLMGVDYDTSENFPADDTGYGFDNIGDVLSVSPLLLEKYIKAAEEITQQAVPGEPYVVPERRLQGEHFRGDKGETTGERLSYYKPATVFNSFYVRRKGAYRIRVEVELDGKFEFDPGRCRVTFKADGDKLHEEEYGWSDDETRRYDFDVEWKRGARRLEFTLQPLVSEEDRLNSLDFRIRSVVVRGPLGANQRSENKNYRRFFAKGQAPEDVDERDAYARDVIASFARRAYRRPVDDETVGRLVAIAKAVYSEPDESFESGIARAMVAVLASSRFLFRTEDVAPADDDEKFPLIDEYALASRLSYFLWSSMPDDELMQLAENGELRTKLPAQVQRMLKDERSRALVENFAGQWLRARDVEHSEIDPLAAMGLEDEWGALQREFWRLREGRGGRRRNRDREREATESNDDQASADERAKREEAERKEEDERDRIRGEFRRLRDLRESFPYELRHAMRRETEMYFEYILREDRGLLELVDSNYTFLNERLAKHYGIQGVDGDDMRRVELPADSPRGGLLTQGTLLVVTSNPTRTSPVKRGLYILDNILGMPPPPPPPDIPTLESAADAVTGHRPTVRELQEIHRRDPLCHSCHARMDPLGLALENFNALGMWRETEQERAVDASGTLLTGEEFAGIRELKTILKNEHRRDFYRCLTEKLLTYALGRGLEYYDEHTVDQIVEQLDSREGKFSTLVTGIIESAPFQRQRRVDEVAVSP